jgi:uncharacterized LabA/DUF88 family protein
MDLADQKVGILIDAENVETSGYQIYGGRTNYKKIIESIGNRKITRIIYYKPIHKDISQEFKDFFAKLGGEIKQPIKNVDSFLTIDAVTLAEKLDVLIIIGGDKDYLPLLWYLRSRGCKTEVWSYPGTTSQIMRESCDGYFPLDESFVIKDDMKGFRKKRFYKNHNINRT